MRSGCDNTNWIWPSTNNKSTRRNSSSKRSSRSSNCSNYVRVVLLLRRRGRSLIIIIIIVIVVVVVVGIRPSSTVRTGRHGTVAVPPRCRPRRCPPRCCRPHEARRAWSIPVLSTSRRWRDTSGCVLSTRRGLVHDRMPAVRKKTSGRRPNAPATIGNGIESMPGRPDYARKCIWPN